MPQPDVLWCYLDRSERSREVLRGVGDTNRALPAGWRLPAVRTGAPRDPGDLPAEDCVGVIATAVSGVLVDGCRARGLPLVVASARFGFPDTPTAIPDDHAIGRLAAQELLAIGHFHFAYVGQTGSAWSVSRGAGFQTVVAEAGGETRALELPGDFDALADPRLDDFLRDAPSPLGVLAGNDLFARRVVEASDRLGRAVPGDVAVVGVDNDEHLCEFTSPTMTSVDPDWRQVGREAATMLHAIIAGQPGTRRLIAPRELVRRQSTGPQVLAEGVVAAALGFIGQRAVDGVGVEQVAEAAAVSRRQLERRFSQAVGRTVAQQLRLARLREAQRQLVLGDEPVERIAHLCGFRSPAYFATHFGQHIGVTPSAYRAAHRQERAGA